MIVSQLMNRNVVAVYGGNTILKTAEEMAESGRGMVVVMNNHEDRKVMGVLTDKDIINKVIAKKLPPETTFVSDIMTKDYIYTRPDATTSEAMFLIRKHNIKRLLVMQDGILQGIISANDLIDGMIKYKKELLKMAIDF